MEACESKRQSRTNRIINISWRYFILLDHKWSLCDRGNSWNAIFLEDLSKIKEGSFVDLEKTALTTVYDLNFRSRSLFLSAKVWFWQPNVKAQTSWPDFGHQTKSFCWLKLPYGPWNNFCMPKPIIGGIKQYWNCLDVWSRGRPSTYRRATWQTRDDKENYRDVSDMFYKHPIQGQFQFFVNSVFFQRWN